MRGLTLMLSVLASLGSGLGACDDGGGTGGPSGTVGTQACGTSIDGNPVVCQPGQYCQDQNLAICSSGCLSDGNCASNQTCVKSGGSNVGSCQATSQPTPDTTSTPDTTPDTTTTPLVTACREGCDDAQACGFLDATGVASCKQACAVDSQVAQILVDCIDAAGCSSDLPECFGADCGGSYGCPTGQSCNDGFCE